MDKLKQTRQDFIQDFEELIFLYENYLKKIEVFKKDLGKTEKFITPGNFGLVSEYLNWLLTEIRKSIDILKTLSKSGLNVDKLRQAKYEYQDILRTFAVSIGNLIISTDWQSPSFLHSSESKAGRQTGQIVGTVNDYKRDVHLDEKKYEELFLKENIDAKLKILLKTYLVNSGQAAFQTILTYLVSEKKITGKVFCGKSSYFQYRQILNGIYGNNLIEEEEGNTEEILKLLKKEQFSAIFLDSLCNSPNLARPNLTRLLDYIYKNARNDVYLVIDNTCLSIFCQPFGSQGSLRVNPLNNKVHLMTFESLNKYHQFGLDRVTGGIIVCENRDAGGIFEYRKHAGTNISDSSVYALPDPNRKLLARRLMRHQRNALMLAEYLNSINRSKIDKIIYPTDSGFPFYGSFFNIKFKGKLDSPKSIKKFITTTIKTARMNGVNIVAGTSFGLNTTRIYLTSLFSRFGQPFLRVSAGTEDFMTLIKIKEILSESVRKF